MGSVIRDFLVMGMKYIWEFWKVLPNALRNFTMWNVSHIDDQTCCQSKSISIPHAALFPTSSTTYRPTLITPTVIYLVHTATASHNNSEIRVKFNTPQQKHEVNQNKYFVSYDFRKASILSNSNTSVKMKQFLPSK